MHLNGNIELFALHAPFSKSESDFEKVTLILNIRQEAASLLGFFFNKHCAAAFVSGPRMCYLICMWPTPDILN